MAELEADVPITKGSHTQLVYEGEGETGSSLLH